jgi:acyl dehydratase
MVLERHEAQSNIGVMRVGDELPPFVRETDLANWNRYAAVNDEFIPIHMDPEAARAVGMPDAFGMGNLRIAYLHNLLHDWLAGRGEIVDFRCEFRGLNLRGDTLRCTGSVAAVDGDLVSVELHVLNQDGTDTTPGSAWVALSGVARPEPSVAQPSGEAAPGVFLDAATIGKIGRTLDPVSAPPVDTNDIRRWAIATYWPERPPAVFLDAEVAPRDLDPFAWMPDRPWAGDWLWGMGTEPGRRLLNGGQHNQYFAPIRPGDVISVTRRFVDVVERGTKRGPMVFFTSEFRWTNQHDAPVRIGHQTSIYY